MLPSTLLPPAAPLPLLLSDVYGNGLPGTRGSPAPVPAREEASDCRSLLMTAAASARESTRTTATRGGAVVSSGDAVAVGAHARVVSMGDTHRAPAPAPTPAPPTAWAAGRWL